MYKISACIPTYNSNKKYLIELVESILAQDYTNFEIVICDDASEAPIEEFIKPYQNLRPGNNKIKFYRNERNLGMVNNWNQSVAHADGELVIVLGHDDLIRPTMFREYAEKFVDPQIELVASGVNFVDETSRQIDYKVNVNHRNNIFVRKSQYTLDGREVTRLCLRNGIAVGELAVHMFRKATFERIGGYSGSLQHAVDLDMALKIAQCGTTIYINKAFLLRRFHDNNLTWKNLAAGKVSADRMRIYENNHIKYPFTYREQMEFRTYLIACACYDIIRLPKHKSWPVVWGAAKQIYHYKHFHPTIFWDHLKELAEHTNLDRC